MTRTAAVWWSGALVAVATMLGGPAGVARAQTVSAELIDVDPEVSERGSPMEHARSAENAPQVMLYFAVGGGGNAKFHTASGATYLPTVDNDATVGTGARLELPLLPFLAVGGQIDFLSYKVEGSERDVSGHFDLWLKLRHYRRITTGVAQEAYLGVPAGFSIVRYPNNPLLDRENNAFGWNVGALVGGALYVDGRYGTFLEMGWRRIQTYNTVLATDTDVTVITNQFALNLGYSLIF